jgi:hypothetical protein
MSWDALIGAAIMLVGVLVGYAIAATKNPKPMETHIINTSGWKKDTTDGFGSGTES